MMDFPAFLSFTITNACNLRCWMCGQWSAEGYMRNAPVNARGAMTLDDWTRVADEAAAHGIRSALLRGGEPMLHPDFLPLLRHLRGLGWHVSIDSNGTLLDRFAEEIAALGEIHITVSIDGPEEIHDRVRGVPGTYQKVRAGIHKLHTATGAAGKPVSLSLNFTICKESLAGLDTLPDAARDLGVEEVCIVPYYYMPAVVGAEYEREMRERFGCRAYSWRGFHHEESGVDPEEFAARHRGFLENLRGIRSFPYMPFTGEEYRLWFTDPVAPVRTSACGNVERLLDIQPGGEADFCVDFPDYAIGNVREATLAEIWNGERAERFRADRRERPLGACHRCGAKYMAELPG